MVTILKNKQLNDKNVVSEDTLFCTFFKNTLLPRHLISKFSYLINNTKTEYITGNFLTPKNKIVIRHIMRGYLLIWLIINYGYLNEDMVVRQLYSSEISKKLYKVSIFNYFNNNYFKEYYFNNIYIQNITKSYMLDKNYNNTFINSYNFYILSQLKSFEVILNFEDYKYEEDKYIYKTHKYAESVDVFAKTKKKVKRYKKMHTDFFDYIKRKNRIRLINKYTRRFARFKESWNQIERGEDNEESIKQIKYFKNVKNHLALQNNIFFGFIIYDLALNINYNLNIHYNNLHLEKKDKVLLNYYNSSFFNKNLIILLKDRYSEEKKEKIKKYPYSLTSLYYNYKWSKRKLTKKMKKRIKKFKHLYFKPYLNYEKIAKQQYKYAKKAKKYKYAKKAKKYKYNKTEFNVNNDLLSIKNFGIKMPFVFFLLHTWYSIYYRRARYNFYIRGDFFFQEHFSKIQYFIWVNNILTGRAVAKLPTYKAQKLFTIYHLKTHVEMKRFNDWFYFYAADYIKLQHYININKKQHKLSLSMLLNSSYMQKLLNVKNENVKTGNKNKGYYKTFFFYYTSTYHHCYEVYNAYTLFMQTPVTRYEPEFRFGRLGYVNYRSMLSKVYLIPMDQKLLITYLQRKIFFEHFFNLYLSLNFLNFYFLNDFFNLKIKTEYIKYFKILNFYEKIFHVIFFFVDPFFFKYFWKRCYPKKWHLITGVQNYLLSNIIVMQIHWSTIKFNIKNYNFFSHYFKWKIDTGNFFITNKKNSDKMAQDFVIINLIYKQRFIELIKQINFLLKLPKYNIKRKFKSSYHYYLTIFKNYYFDLLENNIEYNILFFFIHLKKYLNMLIISNKNFIKFIYSNYIYRYYIYNMWLESRYYDNWFYDWTQRKFWIYHKFTAHEGPRFYKHKIDIW